MGNRKRHEFLSIIEFLTQIHFLNMILCLILFETEVIDQFRRAVVCFLVTVFEAVTTFSAKKMYIL